MVVSLIGIGIARWLPSGTDDPERLLRESLVSVLPGASRFQPLRYEEGTLKPAVSPANQGESIYAGYDAGGGFVGYAITGEGPGYQGIIQLIYGYRPSDRRIVGVEILASQETAGWGEEIRTDPKFRDNLRNLSVDPRITVVAKGEKSKPNQVAALTGATVSCNSVVTILDKSIRRWLKRLPPPGSEPPMTSANIIR